MGEYGIVDVGDSSGSRGMQRSMTQPAKMNANVNLIFSCGFISFLLGK